ncbi:similar to Saccharomyces cerevisiae YDR036C EHD3 3-hydroxyisobutyryl-CoA hydrolase [Geotrichum candidum]|uniref:Probable enoyl-CoA hydratase, mitochondrial n=1 Tax=Geotrichum candidum TaxID=1173061 RepID=A0A0J9XH11_GEOCN|nr:similar to Saccharomyces cerevisiae YDR036C EHD3 3-hydroxyisobutyryl-CoA hydrolase [Geotrichum candidum]
MSSNLSKTVASTTATNRLLQLQRIMTTNNTTATDQLEYLLVSNPAPAVLLVQLNRPKALNALCDGLFLELNRVLQDADKNDDIRAIVITGSERSFAAGADIKEMRDRSFGDVYYKEFITNWSDITLISKPIIAAVNGFALGGGCELALSCDIIYAGEKAVFGQPEIKIGVIPGAGGSQRLTAAIGKAKAMELILTGRNFSAADALNWGMVANIFKPENLVEEAIKAAQEIAAFSPIAVKAAKEVVNESFNTNLEQGLRYERRVFHGLFGTQDQKEGMSAFLEKRKPSFTGK